MLALLVESFLQAVINTIDARRNTVIRAGVIIAFCVDNAGFEAVALDKKIASG